MAKADKDELERITQKFLKMKKIQLDELIES